MAQEDKTTMDVEEMDTVKPSALNSPSENGSTLQEKTTQEVPDDQYPHGLKLIILAGASVVAVFLIALDQVSILSILAHVNRIQINTRVL